VLESVQGIVDTWEGVRITDGDFIKFAIIDAESGGAIFFGSEYYWGSPGAFRWDNNIVVEHFINFVFNYLSTSGCISIWGRVARFAAGLYINMMVKFVGTARGGGKYLRIRLNKFR
jgi:hypothetical protein